MLVREREWVWERESALVLELVPGLALELVPEQVPEQVPGRGWVMAPVVPAPEGRAWSEFGKVNCCGVMA